ncbi:hypothetical protein [Neisseria bacilliformis]|nr:hypothetical protein [Neisseria bacilliformis]
MPQTGKPANLIRKKRPSENSFSDGLFLILSARQAGRLGLY